MSEGGLFLGSSSEQLLLLNLGLRHGCGILDIENSCDQTVFETLLVRKGYAKFIVSLHLPKSNGGSIETIEGLFDSCYRNGAADLVKVVVSSSSPQDAVNMVTAACRVGTRLPVGVMGFAMGQDGVLSRVLNKVSVSC